MKMYELPAEFEAQVLGAPETAMGHHEAVVKFGGHGQERGFVVSGLYFVTRVEAGYPDRPGDTNPPLMAVFTSEPEILRFGEGPLRSAPTGVSVFPHRSSLPQMIRRLAQKSSQPPPFLTKTTRADVFYRLSAFRNDRRIGPNGKVAPQTYSTTQNDITEVPSGLAAVGRYALPSRLPAVFVFEITPPAGTPVVYGTVTPNHGLAGGGVEAFFPNGCSKGSAVFSRQIAMK